MQWIFRARVLIVVLLCVAALLAATTEPNNAVKAPVLTFIGGAVVVTWFLPVRRPEWRDSIVVTGTAIATAGSWYWLMDASDGSPASLILYLISGAVLVVIVFVIGTVIWALSRLDSEPMERDRRAVERRLRRRLYEVVVEAGSAHPRGPGGQIYEQYDHAIHMLFLQTWSMVNDPHQWTYAPRQHRNLIASYVIERLRRTAEIAINKHPHQCRYGAIAYSLAELAEMYLYRVNIITEINLMPSQCPECRETTPTHKANCMAAICWRCKYPTPPRNPASRNNNVVTPQCYSLLPCSPRGKELKPVEPVALRLRLRVGIPHNGEDQYLLGPEWPLNQRVLRQLLEEINHD